MRMLKCQTFLTVTLFAAGFCLLSLMRYQQQCCNCGDTINNKNYNESKYFQKIANTRRKVYYGNEYKYEYKYDNTYGPDIPLIFVGGFPRSGTTLMRVMLDAHQDIRCGEETHILPMILTMRKKWKTNKRLWKVILEAGIDDYVLDSAISSFMLEIIVKHGRPAKMLCNKDPFTLSSTEYLAQLFPNSKFILMIRDGRAVVHSMISRRVGVAKLDLKNYTQCLEKWNQSISEMYRQCNLVGEDRCFIMYYEQLVLHPEKWLKDLSEFLKIPWNASVLHHEMFIGDEISLSKLERSTDQVVKPVNTEALTKWVGQLPPDVVKNMAQIAPMLTHLGYDPNANPPDYGKESDFVKNNNEDVGKNSALWEQKVASIVL